MPPILRKAFWEPVQSYKAIALTSAHFSFSPIKSKFYFHPKIQFFLPYNFSKSQWYLQTATIEFKHKQILEAFKIL